MQTPDSHPVAVLGYGCWERRFGSDPSIIGKTVQFNSRPFTIIGVAPKGFIGTEVCYAPEMFIPMMMAKAIEPSSTYLEKRDSNNMFAVGRLKPGVSFAQARASLETLTAQMAQDYPENVGRGITPGPARVCSFLTLRIRFSLLPVSWRWSARWCSCLRV